MKKILFGIMTTVGFLALLSAMPLAVQAMTMDYSTSNYTQTEVVEDDFYLSAERMLVIDNLIYGDAFLAGETVVVNDTIFGDLYVGGADIQLNGNVLGSVYIAGGKVKVTGNVGRTLFVAAGDVVIDGTVTEDVMASSGTLKVNGNVGDDVRISGGNVDLYGDIGGDALVAGGVVNLEGDVMGDVHVGGGKLNVTSSLVGGDLICYGNADTVYVKDDVEIGGDYEIKEGYNKLHSGFNTDFSEGFSAAWSAVGFFWWLFMGIVMTLGYVLLGYAFARFAPVKLKEITKKLDGFDQIMTSMGVGLLAVPLFIFAVVALAISVVGWPLLGVLALVALVASQLTTPVVGYALGQMILGSRKVGVFASLFVGILLVQVFTMIPFLGGLVSFIIFFAGIGAMIRMKRDKMESSSSKVAAKSSAKK